MHRHSRARYRLLLYTKTATCCSCQRICSFGSKSPFYMQLRGSSKIEPEPEAGAEEGQFSDPYATVVRVLQSARAESMQMDAIIQLARNKAHEGIDAKKKSAQARRSEGSAGALADGVAAAAIIGATSVRVVLATLVCCWTSRRSPLLPTRLSLGALFGASAWNCAFGCSAPRQRDALAYDHSFANVCACVNVLRRYSPNWWVESS
jgi:hypothetical protein